ncbi:MAG TPA: twin-arginine translocase subunit TatC [Candidatus Dormibacteraeota bacterium]
MASQSLTGPLARTPPRGAPEPEPEGEPMTLVEHLEDLRRVLLICLIAWVAATGLAFVFNHEVIHLLERPLQLALSHRARSPFGNHLIVTSPIEGLTIPFKVSAAAGVVISFPIVAWQAWTFVAPGLRRRERHLIGPFIAGSLLCFGLGAAFAYLIMPIGLSFLSTFLGSNAVYLPDLGAYLTFFGLVIVIFGVTFEMPVVLCLLGAFGIVSSQRLSHWRLKAYFAIVAVALVITPGADPFTPTFLSVALILLYELSRLIVRHVLHR